MHHKNEEEALIAEQAKQRGVAVAQKNREREIAVETERVEKARQLEAIGREREVALVGIARDKEVEQQKKEIADVVRARIAVDKTVAVEEERIKDVRAIAEANREREARAASTPRPRRRSTLVKHVKAAEASEEAAKHAARQKTITADAELETADKLRAREDPPRRGRAGRGRRRGPREGAREGGRRGRHREARPRRGAGHAREDAVASPTGEEKQGLAKARVKEADADAVQKLGMAEAASLSAKLRPRRRGEEPKGLARRRGSQRARSSSPRPRASPRRPSP